MKIQRRLAALPLTALVSLASNAQTPPDVAAAARTNAEQNQQVQQQRDAPQRAATVAAPVVRSAAPLAGEWPVLRVVNIVRRTSTTGAK
ncbi:exported hypothetical protein [Paraburkholderia ribeironis]|uniref:Uncharacterized protein n=1 Tax=Paraburkholderia ribeironis TaxID=1247936 RepID=A0A1N7RLE6_9BURK|nr:exported hypothetical protein [Paraburkholderia ribeironis]